MGLDGVFDGGFEAQPVDGADGGSDFQLVEYLYADGDREQARGGDYDAAAVSAWGGAANAACQSDTAFDIEPAWESPENRALTKWYQFLDAGCKGQCGAVSGTGALAQYREADLSGFWQVPPGRAQDYGPRRRFKLPDLG